MRWWLMLIVLWVSPIVGAQEFPARGLRIVVPFGPGTGSDVLARSMAAKMAEQMGQPVTVENREGAGGLIGARAVLSSPADGYTLLLAANPFVVNPLMHVKPPYDVQRDFTPLAKVAVVPNILIVAPATQAATLRELIALARARPGQLNYASSGKGTPSQLETELLMADFEFSMQEVAYKSTAQAMTDLIGGQVDVYYPTLPAALPHIKSGRVRALAVGAPARLSALPSVPTVTEALGSPGYEAQTWYGFVVAAATPIAAVNRLRAEIVKAMQSPEVRTRTDALGAEVLNVNADNFARQLRADSQKWGKLIDRLGLRAE
ncbi:MAG: tripartite tricarboxylate transporter substrate binding protein [Betaproteobacteria bacterium]|nr:tripartite tricarboxylate transporter substrate binding protein [Betaproteobacteria bacterium]